MVVTQTDTRGKRSTNKFLRYALRRRPCMGMIVLSSIIIPVLLALCIFFFFWIRSSVIHNQIFLRDKSILASQGSHLSFYHCKYEDPNEFNSTFCSMYCGSAAESWRIRRLLANVFVEASCLDKYEHVPCHEHGDFCLPETNKRIDCSGTYFVQEDEDGVYMDSAIVPAVGEEEVKKAKGKTVLANQLVAKCPLCTVRSEYFKFRETSSCFRKLATVTEGWPARWQYCTNIQRSNSNRACQIIAGDLK